MKAIVLLLAVLALAGCEQSRQAAWDKAYNEKRATALQNGWTPAQRPRYMAPKPRFREDNPPMVAGGGPVIVPPPIIMEAAPAPAPVQSRAPQPIIFTGGGRGTTIAQQVGDSTIVSQFGGWNPGTTIATQVGDSTVVSRFGGPDAGTTIATQYGDTAIISQFGGGPPIGGYARPYCAPVGAWSGW